MSTSRKIPGAGCLALFILFIISFVSGCATTPENTREISAPAPDPTLERAQLAAKRALADARTELAAVKRVGSEWLLIDRATGKRPRSLTELLNVAQRMINRGDLEEGVRIANRVRDAAKLGQIQALQQTDAAPVYPR